MSKPRTIFSAFIALSLTISSPAFAANVLLITAKSSPSSSETLVKNRLAGKGFSVTTVYEKKVTASSASGQDLVIISDSIKTTRPTKLFRNSKIPVISFEPHQFYKLGMTHPASASGSAQKQLYLSIKNASSPLAASLTGTVKIASKSAKISWGSPRKGALGIATIKGSSKRYGVFAYETGAAMAGLRAPARRIGLFLSATAMRLLTAQAWALFDAAVTWAVEPVIPPSPAGFRSIVFYNARPYTVWVGGSGAIPQCDTCGARTTMTGEATGFVLPAQSYKIITVPANLQSANWWARTGCTTVNGQFRCDTGDCGSAVFGFNVMCNGGTKAPPVNSFEVTFNPSTGYLGAVTDTYDATNVDGFTGGMRIEPLAGRYKKVSPWTADPKYNCGAAVDSGFDMNKCPPELTSADGKYCWSICQAVMTAVQRDRFPLLQQFYADVNTRDLVCCACDCGPDCGCESAQCKYGCSPYAQPLSPWGVCRVENWPTPDAAWCASHGVTTCTYPGIFKSQVPDAYSWQFNDRESTFQCADADYKITFLP